MFYTAGMITTIRCLGACLLGCGLLFALPTAATTVYRSVDAEGNVSFSDAPPEDGSASETLEIDTPAPQPDDVQQKRLEEMRATTDRMAADRMAREKHRAELKKLQREAEIAAAAQEPPAVDYGTPDYYYGRYWRPGYRPRPVPPIAHPPVRPQPLQGDYPASLIRRHYQPAVRRAFQTPRR